MNTDKLIETLTDAIMELPKFSREEIEKVIIAHVNIENKRSQRSRNKVRDAQLISLDSYKKSIDSKVWLKDQEIQLYRRKLQELTKGTDRYKIIRTRVDKALAKILKNKVESIKRICHENNN
ncbi:hypothetical protein KO02_12150 [Sphingobacterium sp. ML3W]|uniref:hypothetical protein n=1 Tax=Sphingobacterium sp. ML3W TaxID=1538644 RepID=UPI0004F59C32|nr:hypothetical protein [Sphingobacterium sp. ML3W]AIM37360.1 hypothetical protein KO02_12150 [Sphingobacterium sp. ML3W]